MPLCVEWSPKRRSMEEMTTLVKIMPCTMAARLRHASSHRGLSHRAGLLLVCHVNIGCGFDRFLTLTNPKYRAWLLCCVNIAAFLFHRPTF